MSWNIELYDGVEEAILDMPPKIQARMLKLLELMEMHGANLGEPHTKAMGFLRSARKPKRVLAAVYFAILKVKILTCFMLL